MNNIDTMHRKGNCELDIDTNMLRELQDIFPDYIPRMEKASGKEEQRAIYKELLQEQRGNLRRELAKAGMDETDYQDLLNDNADDQILPAMLFDSALYDEVVKAEGDKVKAIVQALYNTMKLLKSKENASTAEVAACLVANNMIAMGEKGVATARKAILEYDRKHTNSIPKLSSELQNALQTLTTEERERALNTAPIALPAALAAASSMGPEVVVAIAVIVVIVLIVLIHYARKDAACILLVVNDITNTAPGVNDNYGLYFDSSKNIHGKETGYTSPGMKCPVTSEGARFLSTGFYTTEKETAALYGTNYGVRLNISGTNIHLAFGVESPLTGSNKCYCGFGKSAEEAAKAVTDTMTSEDSFGNYKAKITMNSKSDNTAYYIARVYNV